MAPIVFGYFRAGANYSFLNGSHALPARPDGKAPGQNFLPIFGNRIDINKGLMTDFWAHDRFL
jgi:hypothetical protein